MSKRYIDADAFLKSEITRCRCVPLVGSGSDDYKNLQELLEETPTADVVEVVRCGECKYHFELTKGEYRCTRGIPFYTTVDDYCSYGERKEK